MNTNQQSSRRVIKVEILDNTLPEKDTCIVCKEPVDYQTSHYGRVIANWQVIRKDSLYHYVVDHAVESVTLTDHKKFPQKIKGRICQPCFDKLYAITWRDKRGWLKRAVETLHEDTKRFDPDTNTYRPLLSEPVFDEASPIAKGLYAPHVVKQRIGKRKTVYYENAINESSSPVIEEHQIVKEKLQGFDRKRSRPNPVKVRMERGVKLPR